MSLKSSLEKISHVEYNHQNTSNELSAVVACFSEETIVRKVVEMME